jgi:hypothetical protein
MFRRKDRDQAIRQTRDLTEQIERRLDKMETVLIIREPSSTVAAEAYDGLRKQIITALSERQAHVTQLVQFAAALDSGADLPTLSSMVAGWLESANVIATSDPHTPDADILFQMVEDLGGPVDVLAPAYVDTATNRVIRQGRIRKAAPGAGEPGPVTPTGAGSTPPPVGSSIEIEDSSD